MKKIFNVDLRVRKGSIKYEEIANELGVHKNSIGRWFRLGEMDEVQRKRVLLAIEKIEAKKGLKA